MVQQTSSSSDTGTETGTFGVNPAFRTHLSYIDRSREYYQAKGFSTPYRWIKNRSAPFTRLATPLASAKVGVVTTSFPDGVADKVAKQVMASPTSPVPAAMFTHDLFWHKEATHTDDVESFLPLGTLAGLQADGRIGTLNDRFYSIPTVHSHRQTRADAAAVNQLCLDDELDAVLLIPL